MNTYFFSHQLESEEVLVECCAHSFEQATKRLSKALDGASIHYHGWMLGVTPRLYIEELSQRQDPICKEYPYQAIAFEG